jgi:hypothetical protein
MSEVQSNETSAESSAPTGTVAATSATSTAPTRVPAKKPSVRFAPDSKPAYIPPPRAPLISQSRQKVGKVNLKRDIPIFLAVFGALLAITYVSKDVGKTSPGDKGKRSQRPSMDDIKKLLVKTTEDFKREEKGRRRKTDCGLFLGDSTIPSAGLSWYAGRNFEPGDVVLETGTELQEGVFHNELFLKHHPFMVNIERDQGQFRATRSIQQGEELFLPVLQHPHARLGVEHPLFRSIPTSKDYIMAEEIYRMEAEVQILGDTALKQGPARLNMGMYERLAGRGTCYSVHWLALYMPLCLEFVLVMLTRDSRQVAGTGITSSRLVQPSCRKLAPVQNEFTLGIFPTQSSVSISCGPK